MPVVLRRLDRLQKIGLIERSKDNDERGQEMSYMKMVRETMKKMTMTTGIVAMLQSGLILEKEGYAMMNEEDDSNNKFKKNCVSMTEYLHIKMMEGSLEREDLDQLKHYAPDGGLTFPTIAIYVDYSLDELINLCVNVFSTKSYTCAHTEAIQYNSVISILQSYPLHTLHPVYRNRIKSTCATICYRYGR